MFGKEDVSWFFFLVKKQLSTVINTTVQSPVSKKYYLFSYCFDSLGYEDSIMCVLPCITLVDNLNSLKFKFSKKAEWAEIYQPRL